MPDALIRFYNGNYFNTIKASSSLASNPVFTLPIDDGDSGEILKTDGNGVLDWAPASSGNFKQHAYTSTGAYSTGTTQVPDDNTIPQNTEGVEFMTRAITPQATDNDLIITAHANWSHSGTGMVVMSLFQDSTANALASVVMRNDSVDTMYSSSLTYRMAAGTTSSTTFKIRIGSNASGTIRLNGVAGQLYGGVLSSTITIFELDI